MTVHCPKCNGTDIREKNVAYAELKVLDWTLDDGIPTPSDYDTDESADWEVQHADHQYVCHNQKCEWEGGLDDLVVRGHPA